MRRRLSMGVIRGMVILATVVLAALVLQTVAQAWGGPLQSFRVTLAPQAVAPADKPLTGRLFVFLSQRPQPEPRLGPNWFAPEPFFGVDVELFAPGETRVLDATAEGFPQPLGNVPAGRYFAQAVLDHDFYHHQPGDGAGNIYSQVQTIEVAADEPASWELVLDQVVPETPFPEAAWLHQVTLHSVCLSSFHGREVLERATVVLPASYATDPDRRYPVIYHVPGFGGNHRQVGPFRQNAPVASEGEVDFIRVMLSGDCKWGHHVYADSATNGPRGQALVTELIPLIDHRFRTVAGPAARFVTGHSSGGWSSLWLQVSYPEVFGGVWSTSPDPVDFRDYQQVDLYARPPLSLYTDPQGGRRPIARRGTEPALWYEDFGHLDDVLKRGGQLRSFEAVFSPLAEDGSPRKLWNRVSGDIDPEVAEAWKKYDIRLKLEENWATLGPQLQGKLRITTGELDTFYLEGAVRRLAESLAALGSDARITILPGRDHGNVQSAELNSQMLREMSEAYSRQGRE